MTSQSADGGETSRDLGPRRATMHHPPTPQRNVAHWRINGYSATIFIWTVAEWERLEVQPTDAQYYPCGIWCALRLDPA